MARISSGYCGRIARLSLRMFPGYYLFGRTRSPARRLATPRKPTRPIMAAAQKVEEPHVGSRKNFWSRPKPVQSIRCDLGCSSTKFTLGKFKHGDRGQVWAPPPFPTHAKLPKRALSSVLGWLGRTAQENGGTAPNAFSEHQFRMARSCYRWG